ncbi:MULTISPECIES: bifunctional 2-polyprenyl-6-hydroxyphenol methylase/3-demethylubiquinol 3-O-methyltransferase UbiG [Anaeromyxobacter]|uniref:class I SAM-dependent methyltransferase n=1 Tax=Anaeromyxobacter TaxID=161492 RepID=UPI001F575435|nr:MULTISPECIES: class I SAM-dependent methyltransferase [unclassified Anaeromyxobacter]
MSRLETGAAAEPLDAPWPAEHLEVLGRCPACASPSRTLLFEGLSDRIFRAAPGRWTLWRCSGCGAAYLDPRPDLAGIGLAYRTYYTHGGTAPRDVFAAGGGLRRAVKRLRHHAHYNAAFGYALRPAAPLARWVAPLSAAARAQAGQLIRHLPAPAGPGSRLLDVGCGNGDFLRIARRLGFDVMGLDLDAAAVARARGSGFTVLAGTIEEAALDPESFEHVTLNHVVEHLHDPVGTLRRVLALLRPGGRVWVQTPNLDAEGLKRFGADWRGLEPPRHLTLFDASSLERALCAAGFSRIALLPPKPDGAYFFAESLAIQRGAPVDRSERALRRRIRSEARRADRVARRQPERGECITFVAHRPA